MSRNERLLLGGQTALLISSATLAASLSEASEWHPLGLFGLLLAFALISEFFRLRVKSAHISAGFLAHVLAMILLGPAPATVIGLIVMLVNAARSRTRLAGMIVNLSTYATFPIAGAVLFTALNSPHLAERDGALYMLVVFVVFTATNVLNFLLIAIDIEVVDGLPIRRAITSLYAPLLPVQFAIGLLTAGAAFMYNQVGLAAIGLLGVICLVFQYLLNTALKSVERKEQLEGRTRELAALQVGLLSTVLQTLSLRDKMTARHSAAVARYAREMARAIGLSPAEQELVHTAGLLHDIGKFIFPDSDTPGRHAADRRAIRDRQAPPRAGGEAGQTDRRLRSRCGDHPRTSRAHRRPRLSARDRRRRHPDRVSHDLDRRHLRRHDVARLLP